MSNLYKKRVNLDGMYPTLIVFDMSRFAGAVMSRNVHSTKALENHTLKISLVDAEPIYANAPCERWEMLNELLEDIYRALESFNQADN